MLLRSNGSCAQRLFAAIYCSTSNQRQVLGEMAEREGFEPSIRFCRILTFQASAFDHSATAPHALEEVAT